LATTSHQLTSGYKSGSDWSRYFCRISSDIIGGLPASAYSSFIISIYLTEPIYSGIDIGSVLDLSTRRLTTAGPILPRLVAIITTPFAPRTPYTALAAASLRTENDSISSGSRSFKLRSTPSTKTNGRELPPNVLTPRIQKSELLCQGSPDRCTAITPGTIPARLLLRERFGVICNCCGFTVEIAPTTEAFFCVPKPTTTT